MHTIRPDINALRNGIFTPKRRTSSPMECVHAYARAIDDILRKIFATLVTSRGRSEEMSVVALGGYGRGEMFPWSDVDIMLLYSEQADKGVIKAFERDVWDLGLTIGFVARTTAECTRILGDDLATDTALLESTFITGSLDLYTRLLDMGIRPYFRRKKKYFLNEMRKALVAGVFSTVDTLYRIEPDVKNGICCLRDCHRIAWAERVAGETFGGQSRPSYQFIGRDDQDRLTECYAFLTKVRTELHMMSKRRLDILELALQPQIASAFGYGEKGAAALMSDFFRSVAIVRQCILIFAEHVYEEQGVIGKLRSSLASFNAGKGLRIIDGVLQSRNPTRPSYKYDAGWVMHVFATAIKCQAEIGTVLRNRLRETALQLTVKDFRTGEVEAAMRGMLSGRQPCGRIFRIMHETGILELIFPEFVPLTCRVEFDSYHEYTTDQHSLLVAGAFDELAGDRDELVQRVYLRIENRRVMRLVLLLHDVGKALEGDHCRSGAIIARNAAARLGYTNEEQQQVEFLVYHHLDMSELSLRRELDDSMLLQFAGMVSTQAMLDMLYLLTVLDIRYVGSRSWTGWKSMQLAEIFNRIGHLISERRPPATDASSHSDLDDYTLETIPEDRRFHQQWLETLKEKTIHLHTESFTGFHRVTVVTFDRISLLADIAACFIAADLQIISARVHSFPQGKIVDVFDVEPDDITRLRFDERMERFRKTWERISSTTATSREIVTEHLKNYPRKPQRQTLSVPLIAFNTADSPVGTIVEIRAPDRFGLFHTLVSSFSTHDINIIAARISTAVDEAVDVFYISDASGNKIADNGRLKSLETAIIKALRTW